MAVPSNPGWKFGYVPSPGEWNNTFAGKVDYPAPLGQGGTGGQDAYTGNYNLQQRVSVSTPTQIAAPLTVYSVRTDEQAVAISLPAVSACKPGDWIDVYDSGDNASVNNITLTANGTDVIAHNGTSGGTLPLQNNGVRCFLVVNGDGVWQAQTVTQGTGIGLATAGIRTITSSVTVDQSYAGFLCKCIGAGITVTLPTDGFVNGNTIAFDNADPTNPIGITSTSGDAPAILYPGDCMIVVADGTGGWWRAAYYTSTQLVTQPIPQQLADTAYTLQLTDQGQYLQFTSNTPVTVTVPTNDAVPMTIGAVVVIEQLGTGTITLVGDTGVTLNSHNGLNSGGQFAVFQLKNGSNASVDTWTVLGDTTT